MTDEQLLFSLISLIIMFIPIGTLLWKFGKIVFQVELNKKDIDGLSKTFNTKVNTIEDRFIENETKLNNIEIVMTRIETKMNLLLSKNGLNT
jgi:hypothetical protein